MKTAELSSQELKFLDIVLEYTDNPRAIFKAGVCYGEQNKQCRGVSHPGCEYLGTCGSICNKCGQLV